jgi:hypothetical protein
MRVLHDVAVSVGALAAVGVPRSVGFLTWMPIAVVAM